MAKKKYQENLKEILNSFDAADVYAELSRYDSKQTKEYKCELEAQHPELRGSVPAVAVTAKHRPGSKRELMELLDMDANMPLGNIDTSLITDMEALFRKSRRKDFAGIETWDMSKVVTIRGMFAETKYFNHDISGWDVSSVRDMSHVFEGAKSFNRPLETWDVSNARDMSFMFSDAVRFNQPLEKWDVSRVENMSHMFNGALNFSQPLEGWDVSAVTDMQGMFQRAAAFNQPIEKWNVSNVRNMKAMFCGALTFTETGRLK